MKLKWDYYSDQPEVIRDKEFKKRIYKKARWDFVKILLTNIFIYPICILNYIFTSKREVKLDTDTFFGMSINLDKNPTQTREFIDDLGVNNILIRVPLSDIENLQRYIDFAEEYQDKNLLINVLQDRRHIEDNHLLKQSLGNVFSGFSPITKRFQVGNAINRKKWAIFSMDEFLGFYKTAYDLKNDKFPDLKLLGSSVIDFEYYFSIRTLFNFYKVEFDQFSSLLYVDRRGAPENTQLGLSLVNKLHLMQAMLRLSPKSSHEIVITETNWPITQTHPYAPTTDEDCCVDIDTHANFLVRYYLLALSSYVVKNVYWHQLIAPGYGLIDNRNNELLKYPAYNAFKIMLSQLQGASFVGLNVNNGVYCVKFIKKENFKPVKRVEVYWAIEGSSKKLSIQKDKQELLSRDGLNIEESSIDIGESPVYLITKL